MANGLHVDEVLGKVIDQSRVVAVSIFQTIQYVEGWRQWSGSRLLGEGALRRGTAGGTGICDEVRGPPGLQLFRESGCGTPDKCGGFR